jgi:general secretion pathway protein G
MKKSQAGFTLAEIMLVIAILGILVSVVLPRLTGRTQEARAQTTRLQIENMSVALDAFELDCGRYPTGEEGLEALRLAPGGVPGWKGPYLKKAVPTDAWKNPYMYTAPGQHNTDYDLFSKGPDQQEDTNDDIGNW